MLDFQAFLRRKWSEYSEASGQKGTVVDELAVKPTGLVMADFYNFLVSQRRVNDFSQSSTWTEEEANFFGAKFFFPRTDGDYATTNARIYFDEKKDIEITTDTVFRANNGAEFRAVQPGWVSKNSFLMSSERFARYYVDIPVIATSKGTSFNVDVNEISLIDDQNFTYKAVGNPLAAISGRKHETNDEYLERMQYTVNDRSLLTKRSMFGRLPEFFPAISSIYIAGSGDKYMNRDLVSGVDLSSTNQVADFLGKITGENNIKHRAFYGVYPPAVGTIQKDRWGPFSIKTKYLYPLTIEATDLSASISAPKHDVSNERNYIDGQTGDPGFHGYPLNQEFTESLYKGLYFDDFKNVSQIETTDLFNINDENVGFDPVVTPDSSWVYGAVGNQRGNMGALYDDVSDIDVINFNNNIITISGGAKNSISVGKDILKRTGIKLEGTLTFPETNGESQPPLNSNLQLMVGGTNGNLVDGYTGVGFGIRQTSEYIDEVTDPSLPSNAIIYFAHGEAYGTAQVFAADDDFTSHISTTDLGAIAETAFRIEPGIPYDFEFIIHDDLRLTLYLSKVENRIDPDPDNKENEFRFSLQSTVLSVFSQELFNANSTHYGTTMKITLDTASQTTEDSWQIENLRAFDTQQSRATALFAIDINNMEDPATIYTRASGSGSVNGVLSDGYSAYIWDTESQSVGSGSSELTRGAWVLLDGISNSNGSKDVLSTLISSDIQSFDRYRVESRFGENIFLLFASTGATKMNSRFSNNNQDDIHALLQVDYIKLESKSSMYFHANNKTDLYLTTFKNEETPDTLSILLTKESSESFFELNTDAGATMPLSSVISVTIGSDTGETPLSDTEYTVVRPDPLTAYSSKETVRIILNEQDTDEITVEYSAYPEIQRIQDYFDGPVFGKIYGDILSKHKLPAFISFDVQFSGNSTDEQMIEQIRKYVDDNNTNVFSPSDMVRYLLDNEYANAVQQPIEVTYSRTNEEGQIETGTFTDSLEITDIEFFRIQDLTVTALS